MMIQWVSVSLIDKISDSWIEIWGSIPAYTKNWLVFWSNDKELSSEADVISWISLSLSQKKKKKKKPERLHIAGKDIQE